MTVPSIYGMAPLSMARADKPIAIEIGEKKLPTLGEVIGPEKTGGIVPSSAPGETGNFGDLLVKAVDQTSQMGHASGDASRAFARGLNDDLHGTMISAKEAEISLKLVGSVRTKLLDAFHELWRISV